MTAEPDRPPEQSDLLPAEAPFQNGFNARTVWASLLVGVVLLLGVLVLGIVVPFVLELRELTGRAHGHTVTAAALVLLAAWGALALRRRAPAQAGGSRAPQVVPRQPRPARQRMIWERWT